jgi:hypothetical protein
VIAVLERMMERISGGDLDPRFWLLLGGQSNAKITADRLEGTQVISETEV